MGSSRWRRLTSDASPTVVVVVAVVAVVAIASRFALLRHGLPTVLGADEPVVMGRAQQLLAGELPTEYDWPTGSMLLLAGWLEATGRGDAVAPYAAARVLFAAIAVLQVLAGGLLAARVAGPGRALPVAAWAIVAGTVAYPALRLSRILHPDPLQALLITLALLAAVELLRDPRPRWAVACGAASGLAAGTKYLGGTVVLALVVAVLLAPRLGGAQRVRLLAGAAVAAMVAFAVAVPAALMHPADLFEGLRFQLTHQSGGHLGYEGDGPSFWWHLTTALPGTWGWPATIAALVAAGVVARRGTAAQRIVVLHAAIGFAVVAWGVVRFPHYVLVYLPALTVALALAIDLVLEQVRRLDLRAVATAAVAVVLFGLPAMHGYQLLRAEQGDDTRDVAATVAAEIELPIIKEPYTDSSEIGRRVAPLGLVPEVTECRCVVEISSYNEDRFRGDPERYADAVAVYDRLRATGEIVAVVRPTRPSAYNWDVLPQWGVDEVPLTGPVGAVGPTITFIELPGPAPAG